MAKEPKIFKKLEDLEEKEETGIKKLIKNPHFRVISVFSILAIIIFVIAYLSITGSRISVENSQINAPVITLSPLSSGILQRVFVREGDFVSPGMVVAQVNDIPIKAQTEGIVISVQNLPGQIVTSQTPVVKMIDPSELRVVGQVPENKGLTSIHLGQKVIFTVDAFGSKNYYGTVDSISPTSRQQDIVFSISDQRAEQNFDVKVRYDINQYPELKNGMSAKMWIYK